MPLLLIFLLYVTVGALAAGGSIALTSKRFTPRIEQVAYGLLLTPIAAIYLAFLAHLSPTASWRAELVPVIGFAVLGLTGTRSAPFLMLGYLGHGAWDLLHEVLMCQGRLGTFTAIPLAYGVFCAVFDWVMVGYFWTRRHDWSAAWQAH
jgi:hypothetical protein